MIVEELKKEIGYDFECNISKKYKNYTNHDEWGCACVWLGENIGAEYNFCIDLEGHIKDNNILQAIKKIEEQTNSIKVIGSYPRFQ